MSDGPAFDLILKGKDKMESGGDCISSTDNVNVRIPLSFMRASAGLHLLLPENVQDKLYAHGVDISSLSRLKGQELENVPKELHVQVDESGGKKVRVFCE